VIEDQVWKDLQNSKAGAQVELESQKAKWRDAARQVAQNAIENLPGDLQAAGITDAQLQSDLNVQLEKFRDGLSNESSITRAPLLPEMARAKVQEIEASIRTRKEELARAVAAGSGSGDGSSKKTKRVRLAELGKRHVVASVEQWDKLDTAVRQELAAGNDSGDRLR